MNIYTDPEAFGLKPVGEIEWGPGGYSFDLTVVWQDAETGALYFGDDSDCSCPKKFGEIGRHKITLVDRPQTLIDHLNKRQTAKDFDPEWDTDEINRTTGAIGALVQKAREARATDWLFEPEPPSELDVLRRVVARHIVDGLTSGSPAAAALAQSLATELDVAGIDISTTLDNLREAYADEQHAAGA